MEQYDLGEAYNSTYLLLMKHFAEAMSKTEELNSVNTLCYPKLGKHYFNERKVLVVGRCLNGWHIGWKISDIHSKKFDEAKLYLNEKPERCPHYWVDDDWGEYAFRSGLWQVNWRIMVKIFGASEESWSHHLAWSNLFKFSPKDEGNPSDYSMFSQHAFCTKLIELEIEILKPKFVVFMTDINWLRGFLPQCSFEKINNKTVECISSLGESKIIVTSRPDRKSYDEFVKDLSLFMNPTL